MEEQRNQLATRRSLCCGPERSKSLPNLLARHPLPLALTDIGAGQICSREAGRQRRQRERDFFMVPIYPECSVRARRRPGASVSNPITFCNGQQSYCVTR